MFAEDTTLLSHFLRTMNGGDKNRFQKFERLNGSIREVIRFSEFSAKIRTFERSTQRRSMQLWDEVETEFGVVVNVQQTNVHQS